MIMFETNEQPWASGPREILDLAVKLFGDDSDINRRLAMILTDNAVEQMIKTYLNLPKRVTGVVIPRKRRNEIAESFPQMLDALEEFAIDKLQEIDLGLVEWYHRLRNELYHQGFGLTVERQQVEIYLELANGLFKNLFGESLPKSTISLRTDLFGQFIALWNRLEVELPESAFKNSISGTRPGSLLPATQFLVNSGVLSEDDYQKISDLRDLRNQTVHGQIDYKEVIPRGG